MFEAHVLNLLKKYLGEYVRGLSIEALKISVWKGDVVLKDLQLKAEALNALKLPITVKAGFLGSVTLKVPWNKLGKEPVVVLLDRIFVLAEPLRDGHSSEKEDEEQWFEAKRRKVEDAEVAMLEAKDKKSAPIEASDERSSWLGSLIATIVGNLKISITNLHIRYEDTISNPGHPFCAGVTLATLAAVTIDEAGAETFVASGALEKLCKSLQLLRFAVYHDSDSKPWQPGKNWEDMSPQEWTEIFEEGVLQDVHEGSLPPKWSSGRQYLLHPVDGMMRYYRRGKREKRDKDVPLQELSLVLDQLSVTVSELQYCDGMKLLESVSRYRTRMPYARFRPLAAVSTSPRAWWLYGCQAVLQQQRLIWYRFSWPKIAHYCQLRRKYVQLYANCLQQSPKVNNPEIKKWDEELDVEVILLWRFLAHAKVESTRSKEAARERERLKKSTWWSLGWGTADKDASATSSMEIESSVSGQLTEEEWKTLNELMSYKPGEEASQEAPNMLQITYSITIQRSAARVLDRSKTEILCGTFVNLHVGLRLYPKTVDSDLQLQFYGLSAPEGPLLESVSREGREHALTTTFVHSPLEEHLDWKLSATMSPMHVTVWRGSFDRFLGFLRSARALSPEVAFETAAALQSKFEEVTRRAQEQLQLVLEESKRFSICLDLDAPKITIPGDMLGNSGRTTQLLVDLGHFKLHTAEHNVDGKHKDGLYSRFHIVGSDISAFLADGHFDWSEAPSDLIGDVDMEFDQSGGLGRQIFPVLDRCGMSVVFDQIQVPHASSPSTRVAIQVPHVGLHFSPARYERLMCLMKAVSGVEQQNEHNSIAAASEVVASWHPRDHAGEVRVLLWGGIGSTVAEWQSRWAVLAGPYLYILESDTAQTYQRCFSLVGKQVMEIPPAGIGGSDHVIAVCSRGTDLQKVIESSSAAVMQLRTEEVKAAWLNHLTLATNKAAASTALSLPAALGGEMQESRLKPPDQLNLFVAGSLDELQLFISGSTAYISPGSSSEERLIAELQAYGGKVDVLQRQHDMTVNIKLHSLKIEDKLQGHISPSCQYIAKSVLLSKTSNGEADDFEVSPMETGLPSHLPHSASMGEEDDEYYRDALPDFGGTSPDSHSSTPRAVFSTFASSKPSEKLSAFDTTPSVKTLPFWRLEFASLLKAESLLDQTNEHNDEGQAADFVRIKISFRESASPEYDGTDTQISIRVATLDFFCNRPTIVTVIEFGCALSEILADIGEPAQDRDLMSGGESHVDTAEPKGRDVVKGLLGRGKSRVVFRLKMDMESARIYLNKEDGSLLAMLAQEKFQMDLKVYPGSFIIAGTLGNLRVCDMLLGPEHQWGWFCDMRDPNCESLVKLEFQSFNKDDDDFEGYDYSLSGKLSAVRIVFLYRFIQEITEYFMALAMPQVQQMIMVADEVGSIGRLFQQFEMDGAPAVKLNVGLDTPVIIMPRSSSSREFMQVDLGHLQVINEFEWYGGTKEDPSAVHMDVLYAEMAGINMVVGIDGVPGKDMVQEARGLHVKVRRPLRDLLKKVAEVQVDVQIEKLSGIMSDKEYLVITDCAATNLAELPNLPPSFREDSGGVDRVTEDIAEFQKQESEQPDSGTNLEQAASSWTKLRVNVHVQHAELELYTGLERESPLARLEMQGFWLGYCVTSIQELDVYVTLPNLSVIDLRPDTKPEMRLMLGSMTEVESSYTPSESSDAEQGLAVNSPSEYSAPRLTMLVMDIRIKQMSQAVVIRVQRPRLLVVVDFLLAVGQFFVPSLGALTGQDELAADPILAGNHIRLESAVHEQKDELVCLSIEQLLIAEAHDVDEFVYDGCGHSLWLNAKDHTTGESLRDTEPFIIVGCGKKLRFRNVVIKNAHFLPEVVHLSTDSSYSVLPEDAVVLEGFSAETDSLELIQKDSIGDGRKPETADAIDFVLDVQAVAPELTFYDSTKWPTGDLTRREKLLRAKMDVNFMFASKGKDQWIRGIVKGLSFEGGSGLVVVEPLDVQAEYSYVQERTFISVFASDISMRLSFNVMRLILRFQEDAILRFNFGGDHVVSRCTHFDRIWVNSSGSNSGQQVAIWRPRAPRGYVILSDCATSGVAPPSQAVMALSNKYGRVKKPVQFELIWSSHEGCMKSGDQTSNQEDSDVCCIWLPVAPPGYVALGCVAERGSSPPSSNVVHCVHKDLVTSASISDCIFYISPDDRTQKHGSSIWRIENAAGSFFAHHSIEPPPKLSMCDLREVLRQSTSTPSLETEKVGADIAQVPSHSRRGLDRKPSVSRFESIGPSPSVTGKVYVTTPQLERVWWNKGTDTGLMASIWRPIAPPGYSIVGDCIVAGLEPPGFGIVVRDDPDLFAKPVRFMPRMHAHGKGMEDAFMWFPVSPPGYVSLGCVTTKTLEKPPLDCVRCVRMNLVNQANLSARALFQMQENRAGYSCSLWAVQNQANTFIARPDLKKPPERMAYALAETGKRKLRDNISAEIKIGRLSTTIFNDLSGLMTPLVNTTTTSTTLAANGRAEALNAVVISTFAASTFNTQLEAWEPLIEPFEGIFKYESYDAESEAIKSGERIRITATSVVNLNVTSAGLDTWIGSLSAWRKQAALEQQARRAAELEENDYKDDLGLVVSSALRDDDYEKLVVENKLGCELFLKTSIDKFEAVEPLSDGKSSVVRMPPLRFPDKVISVDESRPARQFVAVHVSEVRDLPIRDDGNGQDYLCALRLAVRKQGSEEQKALPQSARSRCVKPFSLTQGPASLLATVKWNEVFIFEVPSQGSANLEVVVTNQAARAGKGEAVGVISLPVQEEEGARLGPRSSLWNIVRHAAKQGSPSRWPSAVTTTFNLVPPKTGNDSVETYCGGAIVVSKYFFRSKSDWRPNGNGNDEEFLGTDVGLLFAVDRDGPWTSMRSILPLGTIPKQVREQQLAVEVITAHGHKQVNFRSLVTVLNNTDTSLAVAVCPLSRLNSPDGPTSASVSESDIYTEEIFENQRYQPLLGGWGNRWPGHFLPTDPYHWSNRDCSKSSQDSPNIQLPPGWTWNSDWLIDKSGHVDSEGWAYGENFQSLRWPPASSKCSKKSTFDFVRRRRLYRIRQRTSPVCGRQIVGVVEPGLSIPIPWGCMGAKTDLCVQVRPQLDYNWGRTVGNGASGAASSGPSSQDSWSSGSLKSPSKRGVSASVFALSQLAKTEELLFCPGLQKGHSWLAMDADAVVIYDDLNIPLYDWKLTVNAPLKLENRLPCTADFVVWEKPANAPAIQRQHGVVSSGGSVHVYSVDVRRPIYLTWRAQGGWRPEKDTVLISDPMVDDLPSGFWMVHQRSERKLRVSVEHDFGATKLAAKIIRIFVPYWLQNDASLPLSYRLVEIEPNERSGGDSSWLARAAKAAKQAGRRPSHAVSNSSSELRKVVRSLEAVEDSSGAPVMLSLEALSDQYRSLAPSSQDYLLSPRLGLCIGVIGSDVCSDAMSFKNFEDKMERVELKAVDSSGSYYRLSAFLDMSAERTKVVHVQPHTLFVNRLGRNFQIRQSNLPHDELLYPNDQAKTIFWKSIWEPEVISVRMEGHRWSHPFSVDTEGIMHVRLQNEVDESYVIVRTEVRNGLKDSRFLVIFRHASLQAPYRVENRSAMIAFGFRQDGFGDDSWHLLLPGSAAGFAWSDLRRNRLLEILVEGENPISSRKYNIDKSGEHQPMSVGGSSSKALHVSVFQEGPFQVVAISDWKPSNNETAIVPAVSSVAGMRINDTFAQQVAGDEDSENQFRLILELAEFGLSVVDHTPEELIYFSVQNLIFSYATGLGSRTSRFKLRVDGLQIDNQLALTPMPVLFIPQDNINRTDFLLKFTLTMQDNMQCDQFIYPYIGVQCASGVAFLVNIHEPILWRLHEMFRRLNLSSLSNSQTTDVAIDPIIRIGLLNTSEIRFKVTLAMSPTQRPRGMLGFWSTLVASLGNTNEMPIRISPHVQEDVCMRQSALTAAAVTNIRNDVLSQPLMLLTGVDLLGNASSALGHMSKGVAALSMDKKFIRSRQKQESKANVEDIGDGLREGGEALAKSLFRGVTGILTKPLEGARSSGVEGFVQGVGKGLIGAAAQPMSGVLDFLSKTTEGANATRIKLAAALTLQEQLLRQRLPRVIGGDNILRPYDDYKARGQVLMQLAERGAVFGNIDLFKVRGKYAVSDAYEFHYNLPKGKTLMITHRRVILLQHPTALIAQKRPDLMKEPCAIVWDVTWNDLMTLEVTHGADESPNLPPSRLIIHLRDWSQDSRLFDSKEIARVVKCHPGTKQATEIQSAIQHAFNTYGPDRLSVQAQGARQKPARKPYAGAGAGAASGAALGLLAGPAAPIAVPVMATFGALIGTAGQAMLETEDDTPIRQDIKRSKLNEPAQSAFNGSGPLIGGVAQRGKLTANFQRIWWDKGAPWSKKYHVSIWRPIPPAGYVSVGDVVQCSYDPPDKAMVYLDSEGVFLPPEGYDLVWRDTESGARDPVTIWKPRPPLGYVSIGCVVVPDYCEPDRSAVHCVRQDSVEHVALGQEPLWRDYKGTALWHCSLWKVQNAAQTFLARRDYQSPPPSEAFCVVI